MRLIEVNRLLGISIPSFRQKTTPNSQPIYPMPLFTHGRPKDRPSEAAMTPTPRLALITIAGARAFKAKSMSAASTGRYAQYCRPWPIDRDGSVRLATVDDEYCSCHRGAILIGIGAFVAKADQTAVAPFRAPRFPSRPGQMAFRSTPAKIKQAATNSACRHRPS
jgi:hypothetical protein